MIGTKKLPSEAIIQNIEALLEATGWSVREVAKKAKISDRQIYYILNRERVCSIDLADKIGRAFGLTGWLLLNPHLKTDLRRARNAEKLFDDYLRASEEGRKVIERIAEGEAKRSA